MVVDHVPTQPVNPELEARRQYLRAKQEQREYNAMVADVAPYVGRRVCVVSVVPCIR
jgi:hypothetical protein